jgi:ABC-2 type transport system permease protein
LMNSALSIAAKDIREYFSSKALVFSVVALPLLISVTVPSFIATLLSSIPTQISPQVTQFLPQVLKHALLTMGPKQALYWYMFSVVTLPIFLLLPITSVIVLASDSFAGEKERKTIETRLSEPISLTELFIGKTLAPSAVALCVTWISSIFYWSLATRFASLVGVSLKPDLVWLSALLVLVPCITLANVGFVAWISSFSRGFKESQQLSGLLIIPVATLTLLSASGNLAPSLSLNLLMSVAYFGFFVLLSLLWPKLVNTSRLMES